MSDDIRGQKMVNPADEDEEHESNQRYIRQLGQSLGSMAEAIGYGKPTPNTLGHMTPVDAQAYHEAKAVMRQTDNGAGMHYGEAIHFRNVQAKLRQVPDTGFPSRDHVVLEITYTVYTDNGNHQAHILTLTENQVRTSELGMCIMAMFQRPR